QSWNGLDEWHARSEGRKHGAVGTLEDHFRGVRHLLHAAAVSQVVPVLRYNLFYCSHNHCPISQLRRTTGLLSC
ncbi:hypothetical protein CEXT_725571, partial [Caerostris extrusa]